MEQVQTHGRRRAAVFALILMTAGVMLTGIGPASAVQPPSTGAMTNVPGRGGAYAYQTAVSLFQAPTAIRGYNQYPCTGGPYTPPGCVPTTGPGNESEASSPSVVLPPGGSTAPITASKPTGVVGRYGPGVIFTAATAAVSTQGSASGGVTSSATLTGIPTSTVGEIIYAGSISGTCTASGSGYSATTTIEGPGNDLETNPGPLALLQPRLNPPPDHATLEISNGDPDVDGDETFYDILTNPVPNTTVFGQLESVGDSFHVVFNEQVVENGVLYVNAVHEYLDGPTAVGDAYIGHSECKLQTPVPTVTSISPTTGMTSGGTTVVITGTDFTNVTKVQFGSGNLATSYTVDSPTQITATAPAHAAGTAGVYVNTSTGGVSPYSASAVFTYVGTPEVRTVVPNAGPVAGGNLVTINGESFTGATGVMFGSTPASSFTVISHGKITATAPAGTGTVDVTVTGPTGTSAVSATSKYSYVSAPTVTGVSPSSGPTGGGNSVVITGSNFLSATRVQFSGTIAPTYTVDSDTQITVTAPARPAGNATVYVTNPAGKSPASPSANYKYV